MYKSLLLSLLIYAITNISYAENPDTKINGKSLLETFPQAITYHTLFDFISLDAFKQRVDELSPYPFILGIGSGKDSKVAKIMQNRFPSKIYSIIASHGGVSTLSDKVWAGHWLYKAGTIVTKDVSPSDTTIFLEDLKKVVLFPGQFNKHSNKQKNKKTSVSGISNTMVLYELDSSGKPNWSTAEQLIITRADDQKLTVLRGQYGTVARAFKAKQTVAARHVLYWDGQMQLNFSLHCPRGGADNLTAGEWFARVIADRMISEGADGVEFDVSRWTFSNEPESNLDVDNDRIVDHGYIDGVNSFGLGSEIFYRELRKKVGPTKLIQGDSNNAVNGIRGIKYVNGIQLESFPMGSNLDRFSEAFLHLRHFLEPIGALPRISYPYTKLGFKYFAKHNIKDTLSVTNNQFRIGLASATLMGMPHPFANTPHDFFLLPDKNGKEQEILGAYYWDEYHGGDLNNWQWLGRAQGPAHQELAAATSGNNLLAGFNWRWETVSGFITDEVKGDGYSVNVRGIPKNILPRDSWFGVNLHLTKKAVPLVKGREYTLEFEARGDDTWRYKNESIEGVPRMIVISDLQKYNGQYPPAVLVDSKWNTYRISFIADSETVFPPRFGVSEQVGSTSIRNIKVYPGSTERWSREFENGLVVLNMTMEPWKYTVKKGVYRRLKGTQAPQVNNGEQIGADIVVPPRDAVFLVKSSLVGNK